MKHTVVEWKRTVKIMRKPFARYCKEVMTIVIVGDILSSCATIISGTKADITIDGNVDEPVTITTSEAVYHDVMLPTTVKVKRRHLGGQHIRITSENHAFNDIVLQKSINEWSILSACSYLVPLGIDMLTSAVNSPQQKRFFITSSGPSSVADSLHYVTQEQERIAAKVLPAKYHRHELSGGVGFGSNQSDHATHSMTNNFMARYHLDYQGECGDLFGDSYVFADLEYHYRMNRKWDLGALAAWGLSREAFWDGNRDAMEIIDKTGTEWCRYFVIAPSVRYTWYESPGNRYYSRVALGLMRHHLSFHYDEYLIDTEGHRCECTFTDSYNDIRWRMAWHVTVFGINVGVDTFRFFGELGYGCLGVVRFGLSFGL